MNTTYSTTRAFFRPLLQPLVSPEQYDFWARQLGSIDAWARCFARVTSVARAADGTISLALRPNRHFRRFARQDQCDLVVEIDGRNRRQRFAINHNDGRVQLSIAPAADDLVSGYLRGQLRSGGIVELIPLAAAELKPTSQDDDVTSAQCSDTALVYLRASDQTIAVARDVSLLEALEAAGVQPKFGCRKGICNRCSCTRVRGSTTDMVSGANSDAPGEPVRICINRAMSDLELDL